MSTKKSSIKRESKELLEATFLDRFCAIYLAFSERLKDVKSSANLFNKFVRMYFFDKENCCLDKPDVKTAKLCYLCTSNAITLYMVSGNI